MKSLEHLLETMLADAGMECCVNTTADQKTVRRRVKQEGESFLTITLPEFAKAFDYSLAHGALDHHRFAGFTTGSATCLPAFLQGFTGLVFDKDTGVLLPEPDIHAIRVVRQVTMFCGKMDALCSERRIRKAIEGYVATENQVKEHMFRANPSRGEFRRVSDMLYGKALRTIGRQIDDGLMPAHGPGATADKLEGNLKFSNREWTDRLEEYFPCGEYLFSSARHFFNDYEDGRITWLPSSSERPVRIVTVPKTMKTPRIIAIEPSYVMYVQQGMMAVFVDALTGNDFPGKGMIGFHDQEVNRSLALQGSASMASATLDLSEASDRVSIQHVFDLLGGSPDVLGAVLACRSQKADVPGFGVIPLAKFASMGSALTFPVEAMVFLTCVLMGIAQAEGTSVTPGFVKRLRGQVRVYGDDIIVPTHAARSVSRTLEAFGLKVNANKSFWTGKFRESCGCDAYGGWDVTPVRLRHRLPTDRRHVKEIIGAVSALNQLRGTFPGWSRTHALLEDASRRFIPLPRVLPSSPGLGIHVDHVALTSCDRVDPDLQRPLVKAAVVTGRIPSSKIDGPDALLKCLLKQGSQPFADSKHLERAGRPHTVDIKMRWIQPY